MKQRGVRQSNRSWDQLEQPPTMANLWTPGSLLEYLCGFLAAVESLWGPSGALLAPLWETFGPHFWSPKLEPWASWGIGVLLGDSGYLLGRPGLLLGPSRLFLGCSRGPLDAKRRQGKHH